ncbi:MAG: sulfatase modifying factor 1 [Gammaproteobacteria bacterium]
MLDTRPKNMTRSLALTALFLSLAASPLAAQDAPPGLVLVNGGKTRLGTAPKDAEELILEHEGMASILAGETPQVTETVADFFIMPTEVTNEQYAVYVKFAAIKPPYTWADEEALNAGRAAFLEEAGKARQEAIAEGRKPERQKFEVEKWWEGVWEETEWSVPEALAEHPANFIDFNAASNYAVWAGLRLPTEAEWERAARGDKGSIYPWGDDPASLDKANTVDQPYSEPRPVGSYPAGARGNIFDLSGNVWEWTTAPYVARKGYKMLKVTVGARGQKRVIEALAPFDTQHMVLKGGAFANISLAARAATRMPGMKSQSTEGIGFRCASSVVPGLDVGLIAIDRDVIMSAMPAGVTFNPGRTAILQQWNTTEGLVSGRIEGYSIITGYQRALLMPVETIEENSLKNLDTSTIIEPVVFGLLSLSMPSVEPPLDAGTYVVAYRAAGELPKEDPDAVQAIELPTLRYTEASGFNPDVSQILFFDGQGSPMAAIPAQRPLYEKSRAGTATWHAWEAPKRQDKDNPVMPGDTLRFEAMTDSKSRNKGFLFTFDIKIGEGRVNAEW